MLRAHQQKYHEAKIAARLSAVKFADEHLGVKITLTEWSNRAFDAVDSQWPRREERKDPAFEWRDINRAYKESSQLDFAIWEQGNLCAMGIALLKANYARIAFLEGNPSETCPLKGTRILVALEAVASYVQLTSRHEIRVEPANAALVSLYTEVYEFDVIKGENGKDCLRKRI